MSTATRPWAAKLDASGRVLTNADGLKLHRVAWPCAEPKALVYIAHGGPSARRSACAAALPLPASAAFVTPVLLIFEPRRGSRTCRSTRSMRTFLTLVLT